MRTGGDRSDVLNRTVSFVDTHGLPDDDQTVTPQFGESDRPGRAAKPRSEWNSIARLVRLLACLGQGRLRRGARQNGLLIPVRVADGDNRPATDLPKTATVCHHLPHTASFERGFSGLRRGSSRSESRRIPEDVSMAVRVRVSTTLHDPCPADQVADGKYRPRTNEAPVTVCHFARPGPREDRRDVARRDVTRSDLTRSDPALRSPAPGRRRKASHPGALIGESERGGTASVPVHRGNARVVLRRPGELDLREDFGDHSLRFDAGQALIEALELEGESFVVDAQAVQDGRIQVVDVAGVRRDVVAEVVGFAVRNAPLDAAAGQPHAEVARVMVAAVVFPGQGSLRIDGASEFSAPDHQCAIEQAALLEVGQQGRRRLVGVVTLGRDVARQVAMLVPTAMQNLDGADATLNHPPGQQCAGREASWLQHFRSIQIECFLRLTLQVGQIRNARLHSKRHFVLCDPRLNFGIAQLIEAALVQLAERIEHDSTIAGLYAGGILHVQHRIAHTAQGDAVVAGRQEATTPHPGKQGLGRSARRPDRRQHHEGRQVVAFASQAVRQPRSQAGLTGNFAARHHECAGRVMVDRVRVDRLDQGDVIDQFGRVRKQFTDPRARFAVLGKLELGGRDRQPRLTAGHRGDALPLAYAVGQLLVKVIGEDRLMVPQVDLRRSAVHVQVNDRLGPGGEMRQARQRRVHHFRGAGLGCGGAAQHGGDGHRSESQSCRPEKLAPRLQAMIVDQWIHVGFPGSRVIQAGMNLSRSRERCNVGSGSAAGPSPFSRWGATVLPSAVRPCECSIVTPLSRTPKPWHPIPILKKAMTLGSAVGLLLFFLPAFPGQARLVDSELNQPRVFDLGHIDGTPIGPAKAQVAGLFPEDIDFSQFLAVGSHHHHCPLAVPRDVQVAVDVAPHAVKTVVRELSQQALAGQCSIRLNIEGPDVSLGRFIHIQRPSVGADFDAVRRSHVGGDQCHLPLRIDLPDLPGVLGPCGITGVQRIVGSNRQIVGLIHRVFMGEDFDLFRLHVDSQHIVLDVVRHIHPACTVKDDAIAGALAWQGHEHLAAAVWSDPTDGLVFGEIHGIDVTFAVALRSFNSSGKLVWLCQRTGDKRCVVRLGEQRSNQGGDNQHG